MAKFGIGYPPSDKLARERKERLIPELEGVIQRHGADSVDAKWGDIRADIIPALAEKHGTDKQVERIVAEWKWLIPEHEREILRRYGYASANRREMPYPGSALGDVRYDPEGYIADR